VQVFARDMYPFVVGVGSGGKKHGTDGQTLEGGKVLFVPNPMQETPVDASERFQEFYASLEQDLRVGGHHHEGGKDGNDAKGVKEGGKVKGESELRIREILESVERTLCSSFYDRYVPSPFYFLIPKKF
jgi:hypothetical protein